MKEHGDKLSDAEKKEIQEKINKLDNLIKSETKDAESIKTAMSELEQASHKLAQILYQQAQTQQGQTTTSTQQKTQEEQKDRNKEDKGNVVDAEYKEVDDDKKNE